MRASANQRMRSKLIVAAFSALCLFSQLGAYARPSFGKVIPQDSTTARVGHLLEISNYKFQKKADTVWSIDFSGKSLSSFKVILATQDDLLVTFVIIAHKKEIQMTPELMSKLLRFNHSLDRVKVGIDDDGDMFVRTDMTVRVLDNQEFKDNIEQVAAASNQVYAGIKQYLN